MRKIYIFAMLLLSFAFVGKAQAVVQSINGLTGSNQTITGTSPISVTFGGTTHTVSIVADSIGDTQLLFNTGQHLTTTSNVIFSSLTLDNSGLHLLDTNGSHDLIISPGSDLSADRTLTILTGDSSRNLTLTGDTSITGTNTGDITISGQSYLSLTGQAITANPINLGSHVTGALGSSNGGTGLSSLGSANQLLGMNGGASGLEYKSISGTSNQVTVTHSAGSIVLSAPQNLHTGATPTFAALTVNGLVESTSGGFKFPDGTTQTTAAGPSTMGHIFASYVSPFNTTTGEIFYLGPRGKGSPSNNWQAEIIVPKSGTLKNLYVSDSHINCTVTYEVFKSGSTGITTSTPAGGGTASNTTNTASVSAGNRVTIEARVQGGCSTSYEGIASFLIE